MTGGLGDLAGRAVVSIVQQQGAAAIGALVHDPDSPLDPSSAAALHAIVGCAGAEASGSACGSGAMGAAASSLVGALVTQGRSSDTTPAGKTAIASLVETLVTGAASATGLDPTTALAGATSEVDNNTLGTSGQALLAKMLAGCRGDTACQDKIDQEFEPYIESGKVYGASQIPLVQGNDPAFAHYDCSIGYCGGAAPGTPSPGSASPAGAMAGNGNGNSQLSTAVTGAANGLNSLYQTYAAPIPDAVSQFGTGLVNNIDQNYQGLRNGIDASTAGQSYSPFVQNALASFDATEAFGITVAKGVTSLPGALAHPIDTAGSLAWSAASGVDTVLSDNTPALDRIDDLIAHPPTTRQLATGIGHAAGVVAPLLAGDPAADLGEATSVNAGEIAAINESARPSGIAYDGAVYRLEDPARVSTTFDTHAGNIGANHRYSAPGTGSVYGATSPETALSEVENYGPSAGKISASANIKLNNVLDLTNPETLKALNVTPDQIIGDSYKITQQIGDFARKNGYDGILAPSARNLGGSNLVIFPKGN